jgi:hypothetical protein
MAEGKKLSEENTYKNMFEQSVLALAAIDEALGIGDDGCSDTENTLYAIAELKAAATREWVGLTSSEVVDAYCSVSDKEWSIGGLDYARVFFCAIEAKLKEKNT